MTVIFMAHLACFLGAQDQQARSDTIYGEAESSYINSHQCPPRPKHTTDQSGVEIFSTEVAFLQMTLACVKFT